MNYNKEISTMVRVAPDVNNIYCNIQIKGGDTGIKYEPHTAMRFNNSFSQSIIPDLQNYFMGVVTLSLSSHSIPLMYWSMISSGLGQNNPDLTTWFLTFVYGGVDYQINMAYISPTNMPKPLAPGFNPPTYKPFYSPYYNISNYNQVCRMINLSLNTIYTNMFNANPAIAGLGLTLNDAPYFIYDDSDRVTMVYNKLFVGSGIDLYMNDQMNIKIEGMDIEYYGSNTDQKDYKILFVNSFNNEYDATHYKNSQLYPGFAQANQVVNQLIITSSTIRSRGEFVAVSDTSTLNIPSILFSLNPLVETPLQAKSKLLYTASGEYRLIDVGSGDLRSLDFQVYYTDVSGNFLPIYLADGETATLKIGFFRKSMYSNAY